MTDRWRRSIQNPYMEQPMRYCALIASSFMLFMLASCGPKSEETTTTPTNPNQAAGKTFKIGYVLHGLNPFTEQIKRGAEGAGKKYGVLGPTFDLFRKRIQ